MSHNSSSTFTLELETNWFTFGLCFHSVKNMLLPTLQLLVGNVQARIGMLFLEKCIRLSWMLHKIILEEPYADNNV